MSENGGRPALLDDAEDAVASLRRHGRARLPARLLRDATGSDLDSAACLAALSAKVDRLVAC